MNSTKEFVVGKHNIGYVSSDFEKRFKNIEFSEKKTVPTFQKLPRTMTDIEIEYELKPGYCELGDVIAFMDSAPKECKDGNWNLFYTPSFVVSVRWRSRVGRWSVGAFGRYGHWGGGDSRVFSRK